MALSSKITQNETILVTGCSYTVQPYKSKTPEEIIINNTWSTYIQCKKLINVAECGRGNYEMIRQALNYIFENPNEKIDRVIVALSGWQRIYTPYQRFTGHRVFWTSKEEAQNILNTSVDGYIDHEVQWQALVGLPSSTVVENMIDDTFVNLNVLYLVCKLKNIKLHVFQMLDPFYMAEKDTFEYNMVLTTAYEKIMHMFSVYEIFRDNKADIYGFPFMTQLGGEWAWLKYHWTKKQMDYTIRGDGHPNELGHKLLYETIIENLNDFKL